MPKPHTDKESNVQYVQLTLFNEGDKGERLLVLTDKITAVQADNGTAIVHTVTGQTFAVSESYMAVRNRLDKGGD